MIKMEKENISYENVYLDGELKKPNDLKVKITPSNFVELMRYFNIGEQFSPVATEFTGDTIRTRVSHPAGDSMAVFVGSTSYETKEVVDNESESHKIVDIAKVDSNGYLILEPADTLKRLGTKYNNSEYMGFDAKENQKIQVYDEKGNSNKITPLDKTQVTIPPERMIPKFDESGWLTWPKMTQNADGKWIKLEDENGNLIYERAKTKVTIDAKELQKSLSDMKSSDRDYVEFHFGKEKSWSESGHLGEEPSDNESKSILENVIIEGEDFNIILQSVFTDMIKVLNGLIEIYGDPERPLIVLKKELGYGRLIFAVSKPKPKDA